MKFQSIPEEVEAVQWLGDNWTQISRRMKCVVRFDGRTLIINPSQKLEDAVVVYLNEWVVMDRHGDIRTMSNLDFVSRYRLTNLDKL